MVSTLVDTWGLPWVPSRACSEMDDWMSPWVSEKGLQWSGWLEAIMSPCQFLQWPGAPSFHGRQQLGVVRSPMSPGSFGPAMVWVAGGCYESMLVPAMSWHTQFFWQTAVGCGDVSYVSWKPMARVNISSFFKIHYLYRHLLKFKIRRSILTPGKLLNKQLTYWYRIWFTCQGIFISDIYTVLTDSTTKLAKHDFSPLHFSNTPLFPQPVMGSWRLIGDLFPSVNLFCFGTCSCCTPD